MGVIKNIRIELIVLGAIFLNVLVSYNIDIGLYNYFAKFGGGPGSVYLKEFFRNITNFGDSLWYFLTFVILFFSTFLISKKFLNLEKYRIYFKYFSITALVYLSATGILTQFLKHIIGRARPNYTSLDESFKFDFFTTSSSFHSFPSGHASTIFIVCLLLGVLIPRLKYFFYLFAVVVAISRVVVGAHFTTDIVAGALVALIVFKILNSFFTNKFYYLKPKPINKSGMSPLYYFLIVFCLVALLLTIGPTFDLFFSDLFYLGKKQFLLQSTSFITIIFRNIMLPFILIYVLFLPIVSKIFPIKKIFFNYDFSFKNILFIWSSLIISIIIIINILLKGLWGRARPNDILQLGGGDIYSPWYKITDECLNNCSFVSGDASVGFSMLVLFFITRKTIYCYLAIVLGSLLGLVRIAEGGHFLSDVVFSFLVMAISTILLFIFYKKYYDK